MESSLHPDFEVVTRHVVMDKDLNGAGNLFGGTMLAWLDEASAIHVFSKIGYADFVTVAMDDVCFRAPAHRGDLISIHCRVVKTGNSSVVAEVKAVVEDLGTHRRCDSITCTITYVCMKEGQPYPYFRSREYSQWLTERQ